jgi:hypothetical protein
MKLQSRSLLNALDRWDGIVWTKVYTAPASQKLLGIHAISNTEVWAGGNNGK